MIKATESIGSFSYKFIQIGMFSACLAGHYNPLLVLASPTHTYQSLALTQLYTPFLNE